MAENEQVQELPVKESKKIIWESFLRDERVTVKPIESSGKWSNLLVKGEEMKKEPHLYDKVKRSFQVPLQSGNKGGGIPEVLDSKVTKMIQNHVKKYPNGMTQRQFFEEELGCDLNHTIIENNFWKIDKRSRVTIQKKGLTLDLRQPLDMLKYLILKANPTRVCPNYEQRFTKATYEFMLVDENRIITKKVEEANVTARAWNKYAEIVSSKDKMIGFIKALGRAIPINHTEDWLKAEILSVLEKSPKSFIEIVDHPHYAQKIFVQNALEAGAILKMGDRRYTLDNGIELGDLNDTISYLSDVNNQEVKMRIKAQIELSKK